MLEKEPQAPEQVDIHERGGLRLTKDHWKELLRKKTPWRHFVTHQVKVCRYASKVMNGDCSGTKEDHRQYLGSRHWRDLLKAFSTKDFTIIPYRIGKIPLPLIGRNAYVDNKIAVEVKDYALEESKSIQTLNDHYCELYDNNFGFMWVPHEESDVSSGEWMYFQTIKKEVRIPVWHSKYDLEEEYAGIKELDRPTEIRYKKVQTVVCDEEPLLNTWLLTSNEVEDPLHKGPFELEKIVKSLNANLLNDRLNNFLNQRGHSNKIVGGWEKQIPQS